MTDLDFPSTQDPSTLDSTTQETLDQSLDPDIEMAIDPNPQLSEPTAEPPPGPRDPMRKDISLRDFLSKMDDYAPIVRIPFPPKFPPLSQVFTFIQIPIR